MRIIRVVALLSVSVFLLTYSDVTNGAPPSDVKSAAAKGETLRVDATVAVDANTILVPSFLGVGVEWSSYPWWDVSQADWDKVFRRLEYMRMPLTRVMLDTFWYCQGFDENGDPIYTWDTTFMKKLYTLLDWCERNNTVVIIGEWGRPNGRDLDLPADDPRWIRIVSDFVEYMLNQKGYTCLKYYNLVNEPHGSWSGVTWDEWYTAITNLQVEFQKRGLLDKISIAAPDGDRNFTTRCLKRKKLTELTGIYDEHWYVAALEVERGLLELYTREQLRQIRKVDPGKRFILGEIGLVDGKNKNDQQLNVYNFWYGVSMADAAVQLIRGGADGFIAWDLDDSMHFCGDGGESMNALSDVLPDDAYKRRKIWGFWSILGAENGNPEDENLRPWYYPWAILTRAFPPGCQPLEAESSGITDLRVGAARIPSGGGYHMSFAVVNNSKWQRRVKIQVPGVVGTTDFGVYEYFDSNNDNKVDSWSRVVDEKGNDIYPKATKQRMGVNVGTGFVVDLPTKGVVVLTTLEHGEPVAVKKRR